MKLVVISDTHGQHDKLTIPECDVLIHCGDFTPDGKYNHVRDFTFWFKRQPATHKIVIAGNHELTLDQTHDLYNIHCHELLTKNDNFHYLEDEQLVINGIKFYGTPWTPWFYNWGFNGLTTEQIPNHIGTPLQVPYGKIPEDTQVLICHGPPYDILDKTLSGDDRVGSVQMRQITRKLPFLQLYLCGHIHEARGMEVTDGNVTYVNASTLDRSYRIIRQPYIIHLDESGCVESVEELSQ